MVEKEKVNVLFLTLYPIKNPRHGGQHRANNIVKVYKNEGYIVKHLYATSSADCGAIDITETHLDNDCYIIPEKELEELKYETFVAEVKDHLIGLYLENDIKIKKIIIDIIENNNLKYIDIEQPWFAGVIIKIKVENPELFKGIHIIYGSHNLEYELKENMISDAIHCKREIISDIKNVEMKAAQNADIVLAVSEYEEEKLKKWNKKVILAKNGVANKKVNSYDINFASGLLKKDYFLFIGSAHKPNLDGYIELLGGALGCIPPNMKLVIVGGVNHLINNSPEHIHWNGINKDKCVQFYDVTDSELQSLIEGSSAILLPILSGGGTNLKTAEALVSNKPIIGTTTSFRGFEDYIDSSIKISDDRENFQALIRSFNKNNYSVRKNTSKLYWDACLVNFKNEIKVIR